MHGGLRGRLTSIPPTNSEKYQLLLFDIRREITCDINVCIPNNIFENIFG